MASCLIDQLILSPIILQLRVIYLLLHYLCDRHIGDFMESNWLHIYDLDTYSLTIMILKREMKLIVVYVFFAFLYTWLQLVKSNYAVTYMKTLFVG